MMRMQFKFDSPSAFRDTMTTGRLRSMLEGDRLLLEEFGKLPRIVTVTKVTGKGQGMLGRIYVERQQFLKDGVECYDGDCFLRKPTEKEVAVLAEMEQIKQQV